MILKRWIGYQVNHRYFSQFLEVGSIQVESLKHFPTHVFIQFQKRLSKVVVVMTQQRVAWEC